MATFITRKLLPLYVVVNNNSATLTIMDMLGKVIIKGELNSNNTKGKIDLSELTNGIYFINVSTATKQLFNSKLLLLDNE